MSLKCFQRKVVFLSDIDIATDITTDIDIGIDI